MAERTFIDTYAFFNFLMASFTYPVAASWIWGNGWLHQLGFIDFAGSGVVHMLGGVTGLIGTIILGPRLGRFKSTSEFDGFERGREKIMQKEQEIKKYEL